MYLREVRKIDLKKYVLFKSIKMKIDKNSLSTFRES